MPPENTLGMNIARTFELIDESKGIDSEGKYISVTPVVDGIFHKKSLYRVTLKSFIPSIGKDSAWYDLIIEDHFPGGWRPIIFASN